MKTGLVLEGGGIRGAYTGGVIDVLMDNNFFFDYIIGTSAGACNAVSYVSRQKYRNIRTILSYSSTRRVTNFANLLFKGSVMNMDILFDDLPRMYDPFDYNTYKKSPEECVITATDCLSGTTHYTYKNQDINPTLACRASCSMPFLSPFVYINNIPYLDGGISDAVPVKKAFEDGCEKVIVVLTRQRGYRKDTKDRYLSFSKRKYKNYPYLLAALKTRSERYNEVMDYIDTLEKEGRILVIAPSKTPNVDRLEHNKKKIWNLYELGKSDIMNSYNKMIEFLK